MDAGELDIDVRAFPAVGDACNSRRLLISSNIACVHVGKCRAVLVNCCMKWPVALHRGAGEVEHISSADWTCVDAAVPVVDVLCVHHDGCELEDTV